MKKETARTLTIVVGVLIFLAVMGLASAVWLFTSSINVTQADEQTAAREFDAVRQRFAGITPLLEIRNEDPVLTRQPPPPGTDHPRLTTLRAIHWDPDDDSFARIDLPFWFLRLKSGPIEIFSDNALADDVHLTVEQLERFGPTLVLDYQGRGGDRLIMWTE